MSIAINGNVNLSNRPVVPASRMIAAGYEEFEDGWATVYSMIYNDNGMTVMVTPIRQGGTVLSQDEVDQYTYNLMDSSANVTAVLNNDKPVNGGYGIVIAVTSGETQSVIDEMIALSGTIHEQQEEMYADRGAAVAGHTAKEYPAPRYTMGFLLDGFPIPDPSGFSGAESDLDTMGERDATGYLHRNMVATKHPLKMAYNGLPWDVITSLCVMLKKPKFTFTFPDPFAGGFTTIDAYVGDRDFDCVWAPENDTYIGNLKFSVIEY